MAERGPDIAKRGREGHLGHRLNQRVGLGPATRDLETDHIAEPPVQERRGAGMIGVIGPTGIEHAGHARLQGQEIGQRGGVVFGINTL